MRKTVRNSAALLGAMAIVTGASACGSLLGGEESTEEPTATEEQTEDSAPAEEESEGDTAEESATEDDAAEDDGATDDGASEDDAAGEDSAAPLTEADLTAAGDRVYEFFMALPDADAATACSFLADPVSGEQISGALLTECTKSFDEELGEGNEDLTTLAAVLDRSMIETVDNGDGTVGVNMLGEDSGLVVSRASDGQWYINIGNAGF